jgi:uncharacterized protein
MQNIRTPGVYIQEISKLPASVAPVATAVPAFVGYTKQRVQNREELAANTPVMVESLLEYEEIFGGAFEEPYTVTLEPDPENTDETVVQIGPAEEDLSPYLLHHCMRLYFGNGGGKCWIVSVGDGYDEDPDDSSINPDELVSGIQSLEKEDEPTILVVPEAVKIVPEKRKELHDVMLEQCERLKDRFAIFDVLVGDQKNSNNDAGQFRNDEVGMNSLKYGAAYYPSLKSTIRRSYDETSIGISDNRGGSGNGPADGLLLGDLASGIRGDQARIVVENLDDLEAGDTLTVNGVEFTFTDDDSGIEIKNTPIAVAQEIADALDSHEDFNAKRITGESFVLITMADPDEDDKLEVSFDGDDEILSISVEDVFITEPDTSLLNQIKKELEKKRLNLYPSAAMAGVYARVDRNRGVWKAPANVSLNLVSGPAVILTDEEQAGLNVDPNSGKSINAIRNFHGKGTIVWGARTLAGNDNEWRYIPVRRLFIFIEESIKKATEPVVFEPNDANTWAKTRSMIENFLTGLWRDGALAGATPEEAFFVKVGLGQTMNSNDILEGRMIIEVGLAAVRPAEFIILQFMHKLQES